ncbi:unnamed protein product, partial [Prunus brigantina]
MKLRPLVLYLVICNYKDLFIPISVNLGYKKEHQDVSPPTVAGISKSCVPSVLMPSISVAEGETKDSKMEEKVNKILEPAESLCRVLSYQVLVIS